MDRQMVYAGSIPLDTDLLNTQLHALRSIGALARTVLGRSYVVDGMPCAPDAGAYAVVVGPGSYTVPYTTDHLAFGALPPDGAETMRTALLPTNVSLQLGPPPQAGQVLCWLVQAAVTEVDAGALALPYYNAANPAVAWSGPANSGQAQATQRLLRVVVTAKAGVPGNGAAAAPDADAGAVGLYQVFTYPGRPGIATADIVPVPVAPRLRFPLPLLPPGFTQLETHDLSSAWVAPSGVRNIRVRLVGGGGGGGAGDAGYSGGGGGAGGYAEALLTVVPGQRYVATVGTGGGGGGSGGAGQAGTESSFAGLVRASGGAGGGSGGTANRGGEPGVGTVGTLMLWGGYGNDGALVGQVPGGVGGASAFGGGGRGTLGGGVAAYGQAKGSGGGGGFGAAAIGGNGSSGLILIEF